MAEEVYCLNSSDSTLLDKPRQTLVSFNEEVDFRLVTKISKPFLSGKVLFSNSKAIFLFKDSQFLPIL